MPFSSEKQRRYLWANEPAVAEKWSKEVAAPAKKAKKKTGGKKKK